MSSDARSHSDEAVAPRAHDSVRDGTDRLNALIERLRASREAEVVERSDDGGDAARVDAAFDAPIHAAAAPAVELPHDRRAPSEARVDMRAASEAVAARPEAAAVAAKPERVRLTAKERRWERRRRRYVFEEVLGWILVPIIIVALYWFVVWGLSLFGLTVGSLIEGVQMLMRAL